MTTNGDSPLRQPIENEPLEDEPIEQLFADVLNLADQTVERITNAEVDEHLHRVLNQSSSSVQLTVLPQDQVSRGYKVLLPSDVRDKQFATTRLRPGYDEEEVDAFLDDVEDALDRVIKENEELRAKLGESLRSGKSSVPALSSPLAQTKTESTPEQAEREPDDMAAVARVLSLAQQTADQAIADARREADEVLNRARSEVEGLLTEARHQAGQITGDARARAESLERDAQERHRQAIGYLVQTREELERRIDDLRAFEREYRSRLKAYLEGQVRDLEAGVTDSGAFPAGGSIPQPLAAGVHNQPLVPPGQSPGAEWYAGANPVEGSGERVR